MVVAREESLDTRLIEGSRGKTILYFLGSLAFVVIGTFMVRDPGADVTFWGWASIGFFGLGDLVFLWLLVRPQTLLLDAEGFTLAGGFVRTPHRIRWREIKGFFVYRMPRGGTMVGFNFAPGAAPTGRLRQFNRSFGAEGAMPKGWPLSTPDMVDLLNGYRDRALRE